MFNVDNEEEMRFIHNAIMLANGIHSMADAKARRCGSKKVHSIGMSLEVRALAALNSAPSRFNTEGLI